MRIFITGGTGFIGRFVVNELNNGKNKLLIITRNPIKSVPDKNIEYIKGDLSNNYKWVNHLKKFNPEAAIHLAWEGIPDLGIENSIKNLEQGLRLIKILATTDCKKIIAAGSLWEYGKQEGKIPESVFPKPFNAFTASKNALNLLGSELSKKKNINFIWLRIFYIYGPGQKESSLIPHIIKSIAAGKTPEIRNPNALNDFIYVEDAAKAISKILEKPKAEGIFNVGSGKLTSIQMIIDMIFKKTGLKRKIQKTLKKESDIFTSFYADNTKLRKIGWKPKYSIQEGIDKTIDASRKG